MLWPCAGTVTGAVEGACVLGDVGGVLEAPVEEVAATLAGLTEQMQQPVQPVPGPVAVGRDPFIEILPPRLPAFEHPEPDQSAPRRQRVPRPGGL